MSNSERKRHFCGKCKLGEFQVCGPANFEAVAIPHRCNYCGKEKLIKLSDFDQPSENPAASQTLKAVAFEGWTTHFIPSA